MLLVAIAASGVVLFQHNKDIRVFKGEEEIGVMMMVELLPPM